MSEDNPFDKPVDLKQQQEARRQQERQKRAQECQARQDRMEKATSSLYTLTQKVPPYNSQYFVQLTDELLSAGPVLRADGHGETLAQVPDSDNNRALRLLRLAIDGDKQGVIQTLLEIAEWPDRQQLETLSALGDFRDGLLWGSLKSSQAFFAKMRQMQEAQSNERPETKTPPPPPPLKPLWDDKNRILRFGDWCRKYRRAAPIQQLILSTFQEQDWPDVTDSPLKHGLDAPNTVGNLNRTLGLDCPLRFFARSDNSAIGWRIRSSGDLQHS